MGLRAGGRQAGALDTRAPAPVDDGNLVSVLVCGGRAVGTLTVAVHPDFVGLLSKYRA